MLLVVLLLRLENRAGRPAELGRDGGQRVPRGGGDGRRAPHGRGSAYAQVRGGDEHGPAAVRVGVDGGLVERDVVEADEVAQVEAGPGGGAGAAAVAELASL